MLKKIEAEIAEEIKIELKRNLEKLQDEIDQVESNIRCFGEEHDFYAEYNDMLNEIYEETSGLKPSDILYAMDPLRYEQEYSDFRESLAGDEYNGNPEYAALKKRLKILNKSLLKTKRLLKDREKAVKE